MNDDAECSRCGEDFSVDMVQRVGRPISTSNHSEGFAWTTNTPVSNWISNSYVNAHWQGKNLTGKEIKYFSIELEYYNQVGDSLCTATYKKTGPIKPGETIEMVMDIDTVSSFGFYCAVPTGTTVARLEISKIKIEYMDGTTEIGKYSYEGEQYSKKEYENT